MLQELHEWLASYGFPLFGVSFVLGIALHAFRHKWSLRESAFMAELRKRYPHTERARSWEEIEIECRPADSRAWGSLRARADERGLELRLRSSVVGWADAGWRTLIPWRDLRAERQKHRGRQVLVMTPVACSGGALWVDDASALRLARHAADWWHSPALRRELEQGVQGVWWPATAALLAVVAAFAAWFGAASAGVMTEWPRQRVFSRNYVEVSGKVMTVPPKGSSGNALIAYQSGHYAGTLVTTRCSVKESSVSQPIPVYVSATEPSRASLTVPRDPYTSRVPELIFLLVVLPALAATTAYRSSVIVRHVAVPEPAPDAPAVAAQRREDSKTPQWRFALGQFAPAAPAFLAVAVLIAAGLANSSPPCARANDNVAARLAAIPICVLCLENGGSP